MENHETYENNHKVVSVGDWFVTMLLMAIPFVNLIMLFVWAFSDSTPRSKANWAKASLIWGLVGIGLFIMLVVVMGGIAGLIAAFAN